MYHLFAEIYAVMYNIYGICRGVIMGQNMRPFTATYLASTISGSGTVFVSWKRAHILFFSVLVNFYAYKNFF